MKKTLLILALTIVGMQSVGAQIIRAYDGGRELNLNDLTRRRLANRSYTNFSFATQKIVAPSLLSDIGIGWLDRIGILDDIEIGRSEWGAAITTGRTFVMHPRPLARVLYIGLDATWADVNYARYNRLLGVIDTRVHQADVSMGIGPSLHVLPVEKLGVHAYFRYNPTFATYFNDDFDLMGGYASMFVTGAAVYWSVISMGAEARWGTAKYKLRSGEDWGGADIGARLRTSGMRVYVSVRL